MEKLSIITVGQYLKWALPERFVKYWVIIFYYKPAPAGHQLLGG